MNPFYKRYLIILTLLPGVFLFSTSCDLSPEQDLQEHNIFDGLEKLDGSPRVTISQGEAKGRNAWFELKVENIDSRLLAPGVYDGWCIDWTRPIAQQGDVHEGIELYTTYGQDRWNPLNYFLNIKEGLLEADSALTFREIQAVIWMVTVGPAFDPDQVSTDQLPGRLRQNGQPNFNIEKVKDIAEMVKTGSNSFDFRGNKFALILKTGDDDQDIIIPVEPKETVHIHIEDLGALPGRVLHRANAINNAGQITGTSGTQGPPGRSIFLWDEQNGMTDLGRHPDASNSSSISHAINNNGQIVGENYPLAIIWDQENGMRSLGEGVAYGINDHGVVVGSKPWVNTDGLIFGQQAIMWKDNEELILETLAESMGETIEFNWINQGRDINNSGQIAGTSTYPVGSSTGPFHAVIWENGKIAHVPGTLGGNSSEAFAINDLGQVVGRSEIPGVTANRDRAFIWDEENGMINLGTIRNGSSEALSINNHGQVVGNVLLPPTSTTGNQIRAFYWDEKRGMIILEPFDESFSFSEATGINDDGVISGRSSSGEPGVSHAVRWTITFEEDISTALNATSHPE